MLQRYCIERFLYRLSVSPYREKFILKGGSLVIAWLDKPYRATKDIDLSGLDFSVKDKASLTAIFEEICLQDVEDDGVHFLPETIDVKDITALEAYGGYRIELRAVINDVKQKILVDIGFGDYVTPDAEEIPYPTLLDMPPPRIKAYPKSTVISEKFEAIVQLGIINSRIKDFFDLWVLCHKFDLDGLILQEAIKNTFKRRKTDIPESKPIGLTSEFYQDINKQDSFTALYKKSQVQFVKTILTLETVINDIAAFLMPVVDAIHADEEFKQTWSSEKLTWQDNVSKPK